MIEVAAILLFLVSTQPNFGNKIRVIYIYIVFILYSACMRADHCISIHTFFSNELCTIYRKIKQA